MYGRNIQSKFTQRKRSPRDARHTMFQRRQRPILVLFSIDCRLGVIILGQVRIGEHLNVAYGGYGLWIGIEVEEALPDDCCGCFDVHGDKPRSFSAHVGLELYPFAGEESFVLFGCEFGECER